MQKTCLGITPIQQAEIEAMYDGGGPPYTFREVLLSHERLRRELAGALIVISDMQKELDDRAAKIARLEASIKQRDREIMELRNELNRERSV